MSQPEPPAEASVNRDRLARFYDDDTVELQVAPWVPGVRRPDPPPAVRSSSRFDDFYQPRYVLADGVPAGVNDRLVLIDKAFPHTRFDAMVIVADDDIRSGPHRLSPATLMEILRLVRLFNDFVTDPAVRSEFGLHGGIATYGYNFDPTVDRENGQFWDKRFHLHLNFWTQDQLDRIREHTVPFPLVTSKAFRRSIVDPVSYLFARIFCDAAAHFVPEVLTRFPLDPISAHDDAVTGAPVGVKWRLTESRELSSNDLQRHIHQIHDVAQRCYDAVYLAVMSAPPPPEAWTRAEVLSRHQIQARLLSRVTWLSPTNRQMLVELFGELRSLTPAEISACRNDWDLGIARMTLGGLSYHLGILQNSGVEHGFTLVAQFKLFSEMGANPALAGSNAVRLDRHDGVTMSADDLERRAAFLARFAESATAQWRPRSEVATQRLVP